MNTTVLNAVQGLGNFSGIGHIAEVPKNIYQGQYKSAAANFAEGALRLALVGAATFATGFATAVTLNHFNKDVIIREYSDTRQLCASAPRKYTDMGGTDMGGHNRFSSSTCSLAGKIGAMCHNLGFESASYAIYLNKSIGGDKATAFSQEDCLSTMFSSWKNDTGGLKFLGNNAQKITDEVKNFCDISLIRSGNQTQQESDYFTCIKDTLGNLQLLKELV